MSRKNICLSVVLTLICGVALVVPASAQHFKRITGTLDQVAAGRAEVWGINASREIYRFNSSTKTFTHTAGWPALTQIAVGGGTSVQADDVWGVNAGGTIYRFNLSTKTFSAVTGVLSQIVVGEGVEDNCHPYEVWGINPLSHVYRYNYCTSGFDQSAIPNPFTHIATGGGAVWGLDEFAQIWYYDFPSSTWIQVPGSLQQIVVGVNDVWGINGLGAIYRYDPATAGFVQYDQLNGAPTLAQIAAGGNGIWGIDASQRIYHFDYTFSFQQVPGFLVQIAVGSGAGVWGVNSSNQVYTFVRP